MKQAIALSSEADRGEPKLSALQLPPAEAEGFIHAPELSRRLGVSLGTISNWRKTGLPHIKPPGSRLVLFDWNTICEWLRRSQRGAQ